MLDSVTTRSAKFQAAAQELPEDLRPILAQLAEEYAFHSTVVGGHNWAAYRVLAGLVKDGWRPAQEPCGPVRATRFGKDIDICDWLEKLAEERGGYNAHEDAVNLCAAAIWLRQAKREGFKLQAIDPIAGGFIEEDGKLPPKALRDLEERNFDRSGEPGRID